LTFVWFCRNEEDSELEVAHVEQEAAAAKGEKEM
jgi:hypothetical protein